MSAIESFHSDRGGNEFLGLRRGRLGQPEIVYDNGPSQRQVWRVVGGAADSASLCEAMRLAVLEVRVLPALYEQLTTRSIAIEPVIA